MLITTAQSWSFTACPYEAATAIPGDSVPGVLLVDELAILLRDVLVQVGGEPVQRPGCRNRIHHDRIPVDGRGGHIVRRVMAQDVGPDLLLVPVVFRSARVRDH